MSSETREHFGERLEQVLEQHNLTRRQAAEDGFCTGATIGRWVRGEVPYCLIVLAELHKKHGIDLNTLICGKEQKE